MMRRALVLASMLAFAAPTFALAPRVLNGVDAAAVPGTSLPADAPFRDQAGRRVALGDYFAARPSIVVLGWYGCSNLCGLVLRGVRQALDDATLKAGADLDVVVISIDARETPAAARARAREVLGDEDPRGWHFLTGDQRAIDAVTHALAFRAAYDEDTRQFAHPAGITLVDRAGHIVSTLPGIVYPAAALRASLARTATPAAPHVPWLLCFGHDPLTGANTRGTMFAVRATGVGALCVLAGAVLFGRRRTRRREAAP
jgi:protein SCO1/2